MPFLHLDARNLHKDKWYDLVKNHPVHFEVLEWSTEQERDLIASFQKLANYGGICVRGEDIAPIRGVRILLNDWRTLGPPKRLTVRGNAHPIFVDKSTIMTCTPGDSLCVEYRDKIVKSMITTRTWEHPTFGIDVGIL